MMDEPTWLDQVLAAPAIGITMDPWLGFAPGIWHSLERLDERWSGGVRITASHATEVRIERENGTYLDLSPANLVFGSTYKMRLEDRPGALPILRPPNEARTYSCRLKELLDDSKAILTDTLGSGTRKVVRIGVVADCRLVETEVPPGVEALLQSITKLWNKPLKLADANFLVECSSDGPLRDQCHHTLSKNEYDRPLEIQMKLDWQRVWTPPMRMGRTEIQGQLENTISAALRYFSEFGIDGGYLCQT